MFVENISDTAGAIQEFISVLTIFFIKSWKVNTWTHFKYSGRDYMKRRLTTWVASHILNTESIPYLELKRHVPY